MAVVTHLIILVRHRVFAFTRLMPVTSALALALILGHLVPPYGSTGEGYPVTSKRVSVRMMTVVSGEPRTRRWQTDSRL